MKLKQVTYYRVTANDIEIDTFDNYHKTYVEALDYWRNGLTHKPNVIYGIVKTVKETMIDYLTEDCK
jgi:hypothetical protein